MSTPKVGRCTQKARAAKLAKPNKSIKLTRKQELFIEGIASGLSQSDAYRAAYNHENMTPKQIWEQASSISHNPKVAQRLAEINEAANKVIIEKAVLTKQWIIEKLMANVQDAHKVRDFTASNKALELLGKVDEVQMFVERSSVDSTNRHHHTQESVSDFAAHLADTLGPDAEATVEKPLPN